MSACTIGFPGEALQRVRSRQRSKQQADEFGAAFGLGESKLVWRDTYGFDLPAASRSQLELAARQAGARTLDEVKACFGPTGMRRAHLRQRPLFRSKSRHSRRVSDGDGSERRSAFESTTAVETPMKIQEGRFFALGDAVDAVRIELEKDRRTVKGEARRTMLPAGTYFVHGMNEQIATISEAKDIGGVVYNVRMDVLTATAKPSVDEAAAVAKEEKTLREKLIAGFAKHVGAMKIAELRELAKNGLEEESDPTPEDDEEEEDEKPKDKKEDEPESGAEQSTADPMVGDDADGAGDMTIIPNDDEAVGDAIVPEPAADANGAYVQTISKKDWDIKAKAAQAGTLDGQSFVMIRDADTDIVVPVPVTVAEKEPEPTPAAAE